MTTLTYAGSLLRTLAVYPTSRGFGYAVLEGPDELVDWGLKEARENKTRRCLNQLRGLLEQYRPLALLLEDGALSSGGRRSERVRLLLAEIADWAAGRVAVERISRQAVKRAFAASGAVSKDEIARAIARLLPELGFRLPPARRPWMSEDPRMSIFDAVAMALTYYAQSGLEEAA